MNLTGDILRGHTDDIILSILNESDNYGYQINMIISQRSNNTFSLTEATLYTAFKRLIHDELIVSYWKDGIHVKRKYYSITEKGKTVFKNSVENWISTKKIIDQFMEKKL
jgi:PadR family transcriptional regulator PadR